MVGAFVPLEAFLKVGVYIWDGTMVFDFREFIQLKEISFMPLDILYIKSNRITVILQFLSIIVKNFRKDSLMHINYSSEFLTKGRC